MVNRKSRKNVWGLDGGALALSEVQNLSARLPRNYSKKCNYHDWWYEKTKDFYECGKCRKRITLTQAHVTYHTIQGEKVWKVWEGPQSNRTIPIGGIFRSNEDAVAEACRRNTKPKPKGKAKHE